MRFAIAAIASAVMLAACGGGGGGGDAAQNPSPTPTPTATSFDVNGVAAKGLMAGAIVSAHGVNADGTIRAQALVTASQPTDAAGRYTLHFDGPPAQPYVIQVTVPEGGATHQDEATGQTLPLPPGFTMRALVVPTTASVTANVTPFSEMATEAAEHAGVTADSAQQANNTIKSMLGITSTGDLTTVPVKTTTDASDADEQRLAVMLTAVSQMAATGAAGCTGDAGARTQCVVQTLANATTSTSSYALSGQAAPALGIALQTVLATPSLVGNVPLSVLAPAIAALDCQGVACNAPAPVAALDAAGGIAATKAMFTDIRSDVVSLFGDPNALEAGALKLEKNKFGAAMAGVHVPADLLLNDTGVFLTAINLYNDFKAGRVQYPYAYAASGYCYLMKDTQGTYANTPADARVIDCSSFQASQYLPTGYVNYEHHFVIVPGSTAGSWTYTATARKTTSDFMTQTAPTQEQIGAEATGAVSVTLNTGEQITAFAADGKLPTTFRSTGEVVADSSDWSIHGTRSGDPAVPSLKSIALTGSIVSKNAAGATLSTLQVKQATLAEIPVAFNGNGRSVAPTSTQPATGSEIATASLNVLWSVPGAEFEGTFAATDSVWDKSGMTHMPTRLVLEGRLANIENGVKTDFMQGRLSVVSSGFDQQSTQAAPSDTNFYSVNATLSAQVTAPNRPLLAVSFGTNWRSFESSPKSATLAYRSFANGTPRTSISVDANVDAQGVATVTLAETVKGISVTAHQGATSADVLLGGTTKIGVIDTDTGVVNFTDGSFVSGF